LISRSPADLDGVRAERTSLEVIGRDFGVDTIAVIHVTLHGDLAAAVVARNLTAPIGALKESAGGTTAAAIACWPHRTFDVTHHDIRLGVHMRRPSRLVATTLDDRTVAFPGRAAFRRRAEIAAPAAA
jgi:predicted PhzF superfamily epimerase YddE/YHI9